MIELIESFCLRSFHLGILVRDGHDPDTKLSKRWLCRGQFEW
jgi:hypothetical protein